MKNILRLEEVIQFFFCLGLSVKLDYPMWMFFVFLLGPDISIIAYLMNTHIGAFFYNLFHHKGIALMIGVSGYLFEYEWVVFAAIILYAHTALDRILGFGLKYPDHFQHTHLGWIGKNAGIEPNQ